MDPVPGSPLWPHTALLPLPLCSSLPLLLCFWIPHSVLLLKLKTEPHLPLPPCSLPPFLLQEISKREEASGQLSCIQLPVNSSGVRTAHPTHRACLSHGAWSHTLCCCSHCNSCHSYGGLTWVFWKWFFFWFFFPFLSPSLLS